MGVFKLLLLALSFNFVFLLMILLLDVAFLLLVVGSGVVCLSSVPAAVAVVPGVKNNEKSSKDPFGSTPSGRFSTIHKKFRKNNIFLKNCLNLSMDFVNLFVYSLLLLVSVLLIRAMVFLWITILLN